MRGKKIFSILLTVSILFSAFPLSLVTSAATPSSAYGYQTDNPGQIALNKTATAVPGTDDEWNISLTASGRNNYKQSDIVFVFDNSSSMVKSSGVRSGLISHYSKMEMAEKTATALVSNLPKNYTFSVGVVSFNTEAKKVLDFQAVSDSESVKTINKKINGINSNILEHTNIQAGIREAQGMFTDDHRNHIIVFLSDGNPDFAYDGGHLVTNLLLSSILYKHVSHDVIVNNTKAEAASAKAAGTHIITEGFNSSGNILADLQDTGNSLATTPDSSAGSAITAINNIYTVPARGAFVTDQIGDKFTLDQSSISASVGNCQYDSTNRVITWNIGDVVQGATPTLTYKVKINEAAAVSGTYYDTNKQATFYFKDAYDRYAKMDFPIPHARIGKVAVNYAYETLNGSTALTPASYSFADGATFALTDTQQNADFSTIPTNANYDPFATVVTPSASPININTSSPTINVLYKLKRSNVAIEYYKDSIDPANKIADAAPANFFGSDVPVTIALPNTLSLSDTQLNKLKPDANYRSGIVVSSPMAVSMDSSKNVIKILYTRIQPGLSVLYNFEGGPLDGATSYNTTDSNLGAGTEINPDSYKLDTTAAALSKYHFDSAITSPNGLTKAADGSSILPNVGGAAIVLTYKYDTAKITVKQDYPGPDYDTSIDTTVYQDTSYSLANLENVNDQNGKFTHTITISPDSNYSISGGNISFTGNTTITVAYTRVTKNITVVHQYPDGTEVSGKVIPENYLSENLDPMTYYNQVQLNTQNGKFKFDHYSDATAFNLTGDKTLYIVYGWGDANIKVVHDYPDKADVTDSIIPAHFNDEITVGKAAIPQTQSGTYEVTGYSIDGNTIKSTDKFTVSQAVTTITITYKNAQAGISVVHKYPADSGKADITDSTIYQNVGTTVDLSKVAVKTDDSRFTFDSFSPDTNFMLTDKGATVIVNYKWAQANIKVNFVGQTVTGDGKVLSTETLDSINVTKNVGSSVTSSDFAAGHTFTGYTYKSADPVNFTLSTEGKTVTLTYTKQAAIADIGDNTAPQSGTPGSPASITPNSPSSSNGQVVATIGDNNTPKSSNPKTGGNPVSASLQALLIGLISASVLCGGTLVIKKHKVIYRINK